MSTLLWLPSDTSAAVSPTPAGADWTQHVNTVSRQLLFAPNGSSLSTLTYTPDAADHLVAGSAMVAQFVSEVLPPQAIAAQSVRLALRAAEANANNDQTLAWKLYATNVAGTSVLGTLLAIRTSGGGELGTALSGESDIATTTAFSDPGEPFRLVFEIGSIGTPTAATGVQGHNTSMAFGCAGTDFVQDGDTTAGPPLLMFDENLLRGVANTAAGFTHQITGITKDAAGDALGSCVVTLYKVVGSTRVYCNRTTSHSSTGAYTLGCFDNDAAYIVEARKSGSPNVFDVTDVLTPSAV